jgi:hypothetical protein
MINEKDLPELNKFIKDQCQPYIRLIKLRTRLDEIDKEKGKLTQEEREIEKEMKSISVEQPFAKLEDLQKTITSQVIYKLIQEFTKNELI